MTATARPLTAVPAAAPAPPGPAPLAAQLAEPLPAGTTLLGTDALKTLLAAAPAALANRRIIAVDGASGCGKTIATRVLAGKLTARVVFVTLDRGITNKQVIETIYCAVSGDDPPSVARHRRSDIMLSLRSYIARSPLVLVLDEAQNATLDALELVRQLQEHPTANCGLVIAGAHLESKLAREPMLNNRIALRVKFDPITETDLPSTLAALSPLLAAYPPATLLAANAEYCRGVLRLWVQLTEWLDKLGTASAGSDQVRRSKLEQALKLASGRQVLLP